jgi:hypothetical protein
MRAVGKLEHPNIVRAMDAGCHEGTHFLVMEYVDGVDLSKILRHCGPLRIADATSQGRAMGTVDYMAPEQARDSHQVDIRADIDSLGCTLYKLLTGQAPFSGAEYKSNFDKLMAHVSQPFPAIRQSRPDVPEKLAAVLDRMVAKDRDARYAKPSQVIEELKPFCPGCDLAGLLIHARKQAKTGAPGPAGKAQAQYLPSPFGRGAGGEGMGARRPIGPSAGEVRRPAPSAPAPGAPPRAPGAGAALGAGLPTPPSPPPRPRRTSERRSSGCLATWPPLRHCGLTHRGPRRGSLPAWKVFSAACPLTPGSPGPARPPRCCSGS